jgi:hypothetical protein
MADPDRIKAAEDFVRSVLERTWGQRLDEGLVRRVAEKIVRNLPPKDPQS